MSFLHLEIAMPIVFGGDDAADLSRFGDATSSNKLNSCEPNNISKQCNALNTREIQADVLPML